MSSRNQRRLTEKAGAKITKTYPAHLVPLDREVWPPSIAQMNPAPTDVWRSQSFLVQVFEEKPWHDGRRCVRLSVNRTTVKRWNGDKPIWDDRITWDELQDIKAQVGLSDWCGLEVYPMDSDIVNVASMRHLWCIPGRVGFEWQRAAHGRML
jgi:hypothetical protein